MYANSNQNNLFIIYTADSVNTDESVQVKLPVTEDDICKNGIVDHQKVIAIAASNEAENDRAVLDPVVIDSNMNVIG